MLVKRIIPFLFLLLLEHLSFLLKENINFMSQRKSNTHSVRQSRCSQYTGSVFSKSTPDHAEFILLFYLMKQRVWLVWARKSWLNSHGSLPQCLCKNKSDAAVCIIAEALWNPLQQSSIHLWVSWDNMSGWLLCNRSTSQLENPLASPVVVHGYAA